MLYIILVLHMHATMYIPDGGGVVTAGYVDAGGVSVGIVGGGVVAVKREQKERVLMHVNHVKFFA